MKQFVFLIAFVGCFITSQAYASSQGNTKMLSIVWDGKNGKQLIQVPYNPLTVSLSSLRKKITKMTRIIPMRQKLTALRFVIVNSFQYRESTPLNREYIRDAQHLQEILAAPDVIITLEGLRHGIDDRKSVILEFAGQLL